LLNWGKGGGGKKENYLEVSPSQFRNEKKGGGGAPGEKRTSLLRVRKTGDLGKVRGRK